MLGPYWRHKAAIRATMFEQQLALHDDQAQFKCCPAGRRGGKSDGIPKSSVMDVLDCGPGEYVILGSETLKKAKALHWANVQSLVTRYGLPLHGNAQDAYWETPRGGRLQFWGITDAGAVELLRGFKVRSAKFDEVATYEEHLPRLVDDVMEPALGDLMGQLTLYGTPSYTRMGPWFDIADPLGARAAAWSRHHWDVRNNPYFWVGKGGGAAWLAHILKSRNWEWGNAIFQREYLGLFVNDASWLVVEYQRERDAILQMPDEYRDAWRYETVHAEPGDPPSSWRRKLDGQRVLRYVGDWPHVMGLDYGHNDAFAMTPIVANPRADRPHDFDRYFPWAWKRSQVTYDDAAEALALMLWILQCSNVVCDPAGGGKPFYETFNRRYGSTLNANVRSAHKVAGSLVESIRFQNTELRTGRLKVVVNTDPKLPGLPEQAGPKIDVLEDVLACTDASALAGEWSVLRWKDAKKGEILEGPGYQMDCFDGGRYSLLDTMAWTASPRPRQETDAERLERELREESESRARGELSPLERLQERF